MANGKKVVITGSRGIAAGLVRALEGEGASLYLIGGQESDGANLLQENSGVLGYSAIDMRDEEAVVEAFALANRTLGGITDVIGVVGGSGRALGDGAIHQMSKEAWNQTLELNLTTTFLTAREAIRYFLISGGGSLTLTSSVLATSPSPDFFLTHAYAVAKSAINGLVVALSASYLAQNIRVNAVAPGLVATPMAARAALNPVIAAFTQKKQPLAGGQLPIDSLMSAYLYLLNNGAVTGQILIVDGGWSSVANI